MSLLGGLGAALVHRMATGKGQLVESSLQR